MCFFKSTSKETLEVSRYYIVYYLFHYIINSKVYFVYGYNLNRVFLNKVLWINF